MTALKYCGRSPAAKAAQDQLDERIGGKANGIAREQRKRPNTLKQIWAGEDAGRARTVSRACVPSNAVVSLIFPSIHDVVMHNGIKLLKVHVRCEFYPGRNAMRNKRHQG